MSVVITIHAEKRLKERLGLQKKALQRAADTAYDKGIKHSETTGNLNKWITKLYFQNKNANNIRLYNDKAWIFAGMNLVTVLQIPSSLKKSFEDVLSRKKNAEKEAADALNAAKKSFLDGNWVESELVQKLTGMSFNECFSTFDFSRTASWWSVVGKTEEERQRNGQCIICSFKLKEGQVVDPETLKVLEEVHEG